MTRPDIPAADLDSPDAESPISRIALRKILLEGLDNVVAYSKIFVGFEDAANDKVVAHFADGSSAIGNVLVGAARTTGKNM